jgi:hypothetical protein
MPEARVQQRGPITDTWDGEGEWATCTCVHGKTWPENDRLEPNGQACAECVAEWRRTRPAWMSS